MTQPLLGGGGPAVSGQADPGPPAPADAVADLRATARWTVAATAAVGTLLIGGGPLVAVGKIDDWGDAFSALGGLALTILGIGWAIWHTAEALTPRLATLKSLEDPEMLTLRETINGNTAAFYGPYSSLDELRGARRLHETVAANILVELAREPDAVRVKQLEQGLADARFNTEQTHLLQARLLSLVHAWAVRNAVRRARIHTLAAFGVVALGAVLFLTAANDEKSPEPAKTKPTSLTQINSHSTDVHMSRALGRQLPGASSES